MNDDDYDQRCIISDWKYKRFESAVKGRWNNDYEDLEDLQITGVSIDGRSVKPGDLFVALVGARFDGHDFVAQAKENGAVAALVDRELDVDIPQLVVQPNTLRGFQLLAAAIFEDATRHGLRTIAVTGSNGKTTVKELLARFFSMKAPTYKTKGNFNNHIGVPLTLCNLPKKARFAVIEMGTNHFGELQRLIEICPAQIRVVVSVGDAHLEYFLDQEGVYRAKSEIFSRSKSSTHAIVLAKDIVHLIPKDFKGKVTGVSLGNFSADYWDAIEAIKTWNGPKRRVKYRCFVKENGYELDRHMNYVYRLTLERSSWGLDPGQRGYTCDRVWRELRIPDYGPCTPINLAFVFAAYLAFGFSWNAQRSQELMELDYIGGRAEIAEFESNREEGNLSIVSDAYNANPTSMLASVKHYANYVGRRLRRYRALEKQIALSEEFRASQTAEERLQKAEELGLHQYSTLDEFEEFAANLKKQLEELEEEIKRPRKNIAIIGQMNEVGEDVEDVHRRVARSIVELGLFDYYYWIGDYADWMYRGGLDAGLSGDDHQMIQIYQLLSDDFLLNSVPQNGLVYLKASRTLQLERFLEKCRASNLFREVSLSDE